MVYRQKTPSPKKLAAAAGEAQYFTGKLCKNGHVSRRWTHNSCCLQCVSENAKRWSKENRQLVAAQSRKWRKENPDKAREAQKRSNAKWYANPENKQKARLLFKIRYASHGDEIRRRQRDRAKKDRLKRSAYNKEWRASNIDYVRALAKKWAAANPEKVRESKRNAKAKRKNVFGKHTASDVAEILKMQTGRCAYCRLNLKGKKYHVDHILAVSRGGTNDRQNLQITCGPCNLRKGASDPIVFSRQLGMLL